MTDSVSRQSAQGPSIRGPFVAWEGAFAAPELDAIEKYADGLAHQRAALTGGRAGYDRNIRKTRVAWVERMPGRMAFTGAWRKSPSI